MSNKFTLKQCSLFPADSDSKTLSGEFGLLKGNPQINYCESITSPSVSVEITVLDTDGILSAKGVYGGEKLAVKATKKSEFNSIIKNQGATGLIKIITAKIENYKE